MEVPFHEKKNSYPVAMLPWDPSVSQSLTLPSSLLGRSNGARKLDSKGGLRGGGP
jgi:hypothetical protein